MMKAEAQILFTEVTKAADSQRILPDTAENLTRWLEADFLPPWALASIQELIEQHRWDEIDNRFFRILAFGTGGMRDRTIARIVTDAEQGAGGSNGEPEHAAVGSALLNDFNVIRATIGLFRHCARHLDTMLSRAEQPRLVIAHDVRHFSRHFCELAASTWVRLGGAAFIFDGPRSTPQLSFAVRHLRCTAGIVITASHNPAHDNGYKVYFEDGGQVVYPHAEGIIHQVYQVALQDLTTHLAIDLSRVVTLGNAIDEAYLDVVKSVVLDPEALRNHAPKTVFTPIHGVGSIATLPLLNAFGVPVVTVTDQEEQNPNFPSVSSPNPENAEALSMAIETANAAGADLVLATDPDADRMGVAVRDSTGEFILYNGNTIGALLLDYRIRTVKRLGLLPREGSRRAAFIKTFVTTPLQQRIAERHGLKIIQTLTGFKYIGEKLHQYEEELRRSLHDSAGLALDYDHTAFQKRVELLLKYSTWYVFGGEESYGYLATDLVRDKDANAAALLFCELAAGLRRDGQSFPEMLDRIYLEYGYHLEDLINVYYEGATGSLKIRKILETYRESPPTEIGEYRVVRFDDFGTQTFTDADGHEIPKQDFYFVELDNGYSYAVRGSGTEPKIKFYLFGNEDVSEPSDLPIIKAKVRETLAAIKGAVEADARERAEQ